MFLITADAIFHRWTNWLLSFILHIFIITFFSLFVFISRFATTCLNWCRSSTLCLCRLHLLRLCRTRWNILSNFSRFWYTCCHTQRFICKLRFCFQNWFLQRLRIRLFCLSQGRFARWELTSRHLWRSFSQVAHHIL